MHPSDCTRLTLRPETPYSPGVYPAPAGHLRSYRLRGEAVGMQSGQGSLGQDPLGQGPLGQGPLGQGPQWRPLKRQDSAVAEQMVERAAELAKDSHAQTRYAAVLVRDE